jgi:transposase
VKSYEAGRQGLRATALRFDVDFSSLRLWISRFRSHGIEGLRRKKKETYARDFKLTVLKRMRDEGLSHRQAAALFNIRRFNVVGKWERDYAREGMPGLVPYKDKGRRQRSVDETSGDETRSREDLLAELNQLRLENAYLKKVDALVQARTKSAPVRKPKS